MFICKSSTARKGEERRGGMVFDGRIELIIDLINLQLKLELYMNSTCVWLVKAWLIKETSKAKTLVSILKPKFSES